MKPGPVPLQRTRWLWRCCAVPLAAASILGAASRCQEAPQECSDGEREYDGKCVTRTVYAFLACAEGEGVDVTREIGADVGGTFRTVVDASVGVAYEESQEQDTAVALRKVDYCLALTQTDSESEEERSVVREYRERATAYIEEFPDVLVPGCSGRPQEEVADDLAQMDLVVGEVSMRPDDEVDEGLVVDCIPIEGTRVAAGSAVNLVISSGPDEEGPTVPPCTGTEEQVEKALQDVGLAMGVVISQSDESDPGTVLACDPPEGTEVEPGSVVDVVVSSGPTSSTPPTADE